MRHARSRNRIAFSCILFIMIIVLLRAFLLPYFKMLKEKLLINTLFGSVVFPTITEAMIFLASGVLLTSFFSRWLHCNLKNGLLIRSAGIIILVPALMVEAEYIIWSLFSVNIVLITVIVLNRWVWILFFWCFPFISGIMLGLPINQNSVNHENT